MRGGGNGCSVDGGNGHAGKMEEKFAAEMMKIALVGVGGTQSEYT